LTQATGIPSNTISWGNVHVVSTGKASGNLSSSSSSSKPSGSISIQSGNTAKPSQNKATFIQYSPAFAQKANQTMGTQNNQHNPITESPSLVNAPSMRDGGNVNYLSDAQKANLGIRIQPSYTNEYNNELSDVYKSNPYITPALGSQIYKLYNPSSEIVDTGAIRRTTTAPLLFGTTAIQSSELSPNSNMDWTKVGANNNQGAKMQLASARLKEYNQNQNIALQNTGGLKIVASNTGFIGGFINNPLRNYENTLQASKDVGYLNYATNPTLSQLHYGQTYTKSVPYQLSPNEIINLNVAQTNVLGTGAQLGTDVLRGETEGYGIMKFLGFASPTIKTYELGMPLKVVGGTLIGVQGVNTYGQIQQGNYGGAFANVAITGGMFAGGAIADFKMPSTETSYKITGMNEPYSSNIESAKGVSYNGNVLGNGIEEGALYRGVTLEPTKLSNGESFVQSTDKLIYDRNTVPSYKAKYQFDTTAQKSYLRNSKGQIAEQAQLINQYPDMPYSTVKGGITPMISESSVFNNPDYVRSGKGYSEVLTKGNEEYAIFREMHGNAGEKAYGQYSKVNEKVFSQSELNTYRSIAGGQELEVFTGNGKISLKMPAIYDTNHPLTETTSKMEVSRQSGNIKLPAYEIGKGGYNIPYVSEGLNPNQIRGIDFWKVGNDVLSFNKDFLIGNKEIPSWAKTSDFTSKSVMQGQEIVRSNVGMGTFTQDYAKISGESFISENKNIIKKSSISKIWDAVPKSRFKIRNELTDKSSNSFSIKDFLKNKKGSFNIGISEKPSTKSSFSISKSEILQSDILSKSITRSDTSFGFEKMSRGMIESSVKGYSTYSNGGHLIPLTGSKLFSRGSSSNNILNMKTNNLQSYTPKMNYISANKIGVISLQNTQMIPSMKSMQSNILITGQNSVQQSNLMQGTQQVQIPSLINTLTPMQSFSTGFGGNITDTGVPTGFLPFMEGGAGFPFFSKKRGRHIKGKYKPDVFSIEYNIKGRKGFTSPILRPMGG
jgi:hypothetical protein